MMCAVRIKRGGLQPRFIEPTLQPTTITSKIGTEGVVVNLKSNFANFKLRNGGPYYMYDAKFSSSKTLKAKLELLRKLSKESHNDKPFCFDGRRLFTSIEWHKEDIDSVTVDEVTVSLRFLKNFEKDSEEYYQMINIILNNVQSLMGQERIGRSFFMSSFTETSSKNRYGPTFYKMDNFRVLGGFSTTLTRGTSSGGSPCSLLYLERINRVLNESSVLSTYDKSKIDQLIGRDIITKHNNKTYRISDIKEMKITDKIELGGVEISYEDYFKQRYNIKLTKTVQPFIIAKIKKSIFKKSSEEGKPDEIMDIEQCLSVPGEICFLCGFSDSERSNFNLQKSMGDILKRDPAKRLQDVGDFCDWTGDNDSASNYMKTWGLDIEREPVSIKGRELKGFNVISGESKINNKSPDDWKFGDIKFDIPKGQTFRIGLVVVERNPSHFNNFFENVQNECNKLRIRAEIEKPISCSISEIDEALEELRRSAKVHLAIVFVGDDRAYIKVKSFTLSTGLLTQCVTHRNGSNRDDKRRKTVADKTVMQMFAKLGYDPWGIDLKMPPSMVVGIDSFHSKTGKRSIQASVFSISKKFSQYLSFVNSSKGKNEYHDSLNRNFSAAVKCFREKFGILPQRFLIYRDGVSDSQLKFTQKYETESILKILEKVYEGQNLPQIIYVVVKKRISVKFFKNGNNPNPGTVVDEKVVKPNFYEFYLVSQRTNKGTTTPTNYNVLMDTEYYNKKTEEKAPMDPNTLQSITYGLTHLYFNWQGTIRVPVPTHYAHRLAELVGKVHRGSNPPLIHDQIRERLFYL